jgi:hypothetical protein
MAHHSNSKYTVRFSTMVFVEVKEADYRGKSFDRDVLNKQMLSCELFLIAGISNKCNMITEGECNSLLL